MSGFKAMDGLFEDGDIGWSAAVGNGAEMDLPVLEVLENDAVIGVSEGDSEFGEGGGGKGTACGEGGTNLSASGRDIGTGGIGEGEIGFPEGEGVIGGRDGELLIFVIDFVLEDGFCDLDGIEGFGDGRNLG